MRFFVFLFILAIVWRFVAAAMKDRAGGQFQRLAQKMREAAAEQRARTPRPPQPPAPTPSLKAGDARPLQPFPVPAPAPPFERAAAAPAWTAPPDPQPLVAPPVTTGPPTAPVQASAPASAPMASVPESSGPQVVPLSPDLQRRVMELMDQQFEVGAVRLLCDELHIGILDAQKTVRTLAGLPTTY